MEIADYTKKPILEFENKYLVLNPKGNFKKLFIGLIIAGAAIFVLALYIALFELESEKIANISFAAFFVPGFLGFLYINYLFEARKKKIEEEIPNVLLLASSLPNGAGLGKVIAFMAETGTGPMQEEFKIAENQIKFGMPIEKAFENMNKRVCSDSFGRACDLIINGLNSGANMQQIFRETADDFLETNSIIRERAANATIQKYTLLLAGGFLVPLILGLLTGTTNSMGNNPIDLEIGLDAEAKKGIVEAALNGSLIYIFEYSIIAAVFVAFHEGNSKKAVVYAAFLVPCGMITYLAASGFKF